MKTFVKIRTVVTMLVSVILVTVNSGFTAMQQQETVQQATKRKIQIALLLDTSNSMDGLIDQAKSQLWNIVNELAKAKHGEDEIELEIALYEYGNSNLSAETGYIRQVQPLINDLDKLSISLFALRTNGGQEYCGTVIDRATRQLEWSNSDKDIRMIFIAGNEPFTQGELKYEVACGNARGKDIIINTIHCGSYDEGVSGLWKSGALIGGGDYMSIQQDRKTVYVKTPYDQRINELSVQLNKTYIYYGSMGKTKKVEQETADSQAATLSESNLSARNSVKASKYYKNALWDLVDASEKEGFDITKVDKKTLPTELKNMTDAQLKAYVEAKKKEREKLKNEIQTLNNAREYYIAQQKKENVPTVESTMTTAIKKQAVKKNYVW
ncbi:MAG: VWA domain-containing protein [Bacteroidales bacterium]|nr:VWA domain-containing protein [Bacteroidales bacterium]